MKKPRRFLDLKTVVGTEPRIAYIKALLENLLSLVVLEKDGEPVEVDGFRLRDYRDWLVPKTDDPRELVRYLGSMRSCNVRCEFCYNRGNPPDSVFHAPPGVTEEEYYLRLRLWSEHPDRMLYVACLPDYEVLNSPIWYEGLSALRERTEKPFSIFTNGKTLTRETVERLKTLEPLVMNVSLNSVDPEQRRRLMNDSTPEVGIDALPLLREHGIYYSTTVVAWPTSTLDQVREAVRYADAHETIVVDVTLPGYTDHTPHPPEGDSDAWWLDVVEAVEELRPELETPVTTTPALFEENHRGTRWNQCRVLGVIKNSPAHRAGVRRGDTITAVGGFPPRDRPQLLRLLMMGSAERVPAELTLQAPGETPRTVRISDDHAYPYFPWTQHNPYGLIIHSGLSVRYLEEMREQILARSAREVLVCTTQLTRPNLVQALQGTGALDDVEARVHLTEVKSVWHGGNIIVGDLMVTDDFVKAIRDFQAAHSRPLDLALIPGSGFGAWKRDLRGRPISEIARRSGVPVAVLHNKLIQF